MNVIKCKLSNMSNIKKLLIVILSIIVFSLITLVPVISYAIDSNHDEEANNSTINSATENESSEEQQNADRDIQITEINEDADYLCFTPSEAGQTSAFTFKIEIDDITPTKDVDLYYSTNKQT